MALDIVVGGQYGGEGKGQISAYLSYKDKPDIIVKTGGPNSAHSFGFKDMIFKLRMVPVGAYFGQPHLIYPSGTLIHIETLFAELKKINFQGKLTISPQAGIIEKHHIDAQLNDSLYNEIGSTLTGTGSASSIRALRRLKIAKMVPELNQYLGDTSDLILEALHNNKKVLIEGSQGFGLSNYHGDYPYVTSRDTTVAAFLSQIGIPPILPMNIILVIKAFPTRNKHGNGNLPNELPENFIQKYNNILEEFGGGTYESLDQKRRIAIFDFNIVKKAALVNGATYIAITGLDRLDLLEKEELIISNYGNINNFLKTIELETNIRVLLESWGRFIENIHDNRVKVI